MNKLTPLAGRILCSALLLFQTMTPSVAGAQQAVSNTATAFTLEDGTPIKLRLSQTVLRLGKPRRDSTQDDTGPV